ncbi:unnamed protein product [Phyllotreta striolata]|uniref:B-block binding subunit of TFIIIC domain-containing protein n=1 Tax=Phyllotreta striolata TaxID=444603 RepID=A0A9N9XR45_PHYSR|nr:unnamed protein product [Phyllotreta striolata]
MGKRLQPQFSDINQRIIKRPKKDKTKPEERASAIKRKSSTILEEPKEKQFINKRAEPPEYSCKTGNVLVRKLQNSTDALLSLEDDLTNDLLFSDELKNSYLKFISTDFYYHILDEISLEGLDGITIEAFWKRLSIALEGNLIINHNIKNFIWQHIITCNSHLQIYELPEPRSKLEIYNRFDYINTDIGVVLELAYKLPDIYPVKLVSNPVVLGSCSTFDERIDITNKVTKSTLTDAENRYGLKLAIVADQNLRTLALCGDQIDPLISFLNAEFCLLERVGRSRKLGELTQGHTSIGSAFDMDAKTVFHYKKQLTARRLVSHQNFYIKSPVYDQNKAGSLLHLQRFYVNVQTYQSYLVGEIINFLKKQPGFRIESHVVREMYSEMYANFGKIMKHADFRKCVTVKVYPYKLLHPEASLGECLTKGKSERFVSCFQLIDPYINVAAFCRNDDKDKEHSDDDDDKEDEELSGQMIYNMDSLRNCYYQIYLSGDKGCIAKDVRNSTGFDDNTVRLNLRKLNEKGIVKLVKFDTGTVRRYRYTTSCAVKPDESFNDTTPKTTAKEKILEKQRMALVKASKRPREEQIEPIVQANILRTDTPSISSCKFLVTNFETTIKTEAINPSINSELILTKRPALNLTFFALTNPSFDINTIINNINAAAKKYPVTSNIGDHYVTNQSKKSMKTIALLLRAHLDEIRITEGLTETESDPIEAPLPDLRQPLEPHATRANKAKLDYMGERPVVESRERQENITKEIVSSTKPLQYRYNKVYERIDNTLTERVLHRIQIILNLVNEMEVIEEASKLNKLIFDAETEEGYDKRIDRKSMYRLMKRLVDEGYIKVFKISLYNESINKTTVFICHPKVDHRDERISNACQKIQWKCFTSCAEKSTKPHVPAVQKNLQKMMGKSPFSQADVLNSIKEMNSLNKTIAKDLNKKINKNIGLTYGFKQKFTRIRIMHEFLFYLIYDYTGTQNPLALDDVNRLFESHHIELTNKDLSDLPPIYSDEIGWKMFVPPLPKHTGWPTGWALLCDIIPRFPLSVFLKLYNCSFEDDELLGLLNHPVKRFYLVKDLPEAQRRVLFYKRKYSCWMYEVLSHLVFCGLAQFGPHKYKEKEQTFFYLNRRASIKDTKGSAPGYNQIECKEYPTVPFYFNKSADLEQYWQTLHYICLNTKLNLRKPGNVVTLSYLNTKTEIIESTAPRTAEEALKLDTGVIPGDGKGAGGLDSSLWSHLIKNWFWRARNRCPTSTTNFNIGLKNEVFKQVRPKSMSFDDSSTNTGAKFFIPPKPKASRRKTAPPVEKKRPKRRPKSYTRVIVPKKTSKKAKREYNDELDKVILKKMESRRVRWTKPEEEPAMLCKIGDIIMNGRRKYSKQIVPYTTVRDVLHRTCPSSKYKTSRAIQRYWRARKRFYLGLENKVVNLFKLKPISDTFTPLLEKIGSPIGNKQSFRLTDEQTAAAYVILMSYIVRNKRRIFDALEGNLFNHDHLSDENLHRTERESVAIDPKTKKYSDPNSEYDVKKEIVKSIIHSSLSSKETIDHSKHLFKIYKNYPDALIREAVNELRELNLLCFRSKLKVGKIWDVPFSISQYYAYFQFGTFNATTASEAYRAFADVARRREQRVESSQLAVQKKRYGQLLGLNEFFTIEARTKLVFYVPPSTVALNPEMEDREELVQELARRYRSKLAALQEDFDLDSDGVRVDDGDDREVSECLVKGESVVDGGNSETIDRLKTWVSDCIVAKSERRSPSPEFPARNSSPDFLETKEVAKAIDGAVHKPWARIPTIEEIKEGMLKANIDDENRSIPHITELSDLLSKNIADSKMDAERLVRLKGHFINEFVSLEKIIVDDYDGLQTNEIVRRVECPDRNRSLWSKIERDVIVDGFIAEKCYEESVRGSGGGDEDVELATNIIEFAAGKESIGATARELQEAFSQRVIHSSLVRLVKVLIEVGVLYQTGVVNLAFVHYKFHQAWVVEKECVPSGTGEEITKQARSVRMKLRPWVRVDGVLDKAILKSWLSNIMSYVLNYPNVSFGTICGKYFFIKPVDLFYIVQVLEELGCVELFVYDKVEEDLFAEWSIPKKRNATFLDCLEDIIIQPSNVSLILLGSFFSKDSTL